MYIYNKDRDIVIYTITACIICNKIIIMYIEVSNMNLKDRKLQEAKTKLKVLEEKLKFLEFSNLQDKEEKIIDCKHAIEKQKRIIRNVESYY